MEQGTLQDFEQSIIEQHMPDDKAAQQALHLAMEQLMFSIWLAREHKGLNSNLILKPDV